jgi:ATP-dependent DNA helicase RecQ
VTPEQTLEMAANERRRLLNFLLRWERFDALHACLDVLIPYRPRLVSLRDLRAKAFLAQGRPAEALPVMEKRLQQRESSPARALLARIHLARGDVELARQIAQTVVDERGESSMAWNLLGEVESVRGDEETALNAYRHLHELYPNSRAYLWGMASIYSARGDWVTASGYAVQLLGLGNEENPLSVAYLRQLRDYFQTSGETTRVAEIEAALERRYATEVAEFRERLSPSYDVQPTPKVDEPEPREPVEPLPSFDDIAVSDDERHHIADAVRRVFGFDSLLPGQLETIACVSRGEDVLTILPTGGGKSLCYQLPALLADEGTTLVISPLIALMKDQVDSLPRGLQRRATTINHTLTGDELRHRMDSVADGALRLVYAAPERLRQPRFLHVLRRAGVDRLVIDEVHCVSMWGHDFRPDYLIIGRARRALGDPPLLAMTATAPTRVRRDIVQRLEPPSDSKSGLRIVAGDVTRPNLQLEVFHARSVDDKLRRLLAFCQAESGSGIVYADTRARCEELAALLRQHGVNAAHYHAGIADRHCVQDDFMAGRTRVVVATIAFGMGIDKPDIRFIVHFFPPASLESYYQEAGRAGRDGLPARCVLMYSSHDRSLLTRRTRRDVLPVEFLREVYAAVKKRLNGKRAGRVVTADLERDLRSDDTRVRVALSLLEETGLLQRGPDLPRAAMVRLSAVCHDDALSDELAAFRQAARLRREQWLTLDLAKVAPKAGIPLAEIERRVLAWEDAGWLMYRPSGRDLLLRLLVPPSDATERIRVLLERHEAVRAQRVDEIAAYARTRRCRHGHLNAYLGGRAIERCDACDNCVEIAPPPSPGLPEERVQLLTILRCVANAPWGWGRHTLTRILRGDLRPRPRAKPLREEARRQPEFGALSFRSKGALGRMVERLEHAGFLAARQLDNGGHVLYLAAKGEAALQDPTTLDEVIVTAEGESSLGSTGPASTEAGEALNVDEALFQTLRAWRLEQAREQGLAPFIIFHDSHLRAVAAHRPTTLAALSNVKGVGPKRLEAYGAAVIDLVRGHLQNETGSRVG